jgi:hypothetical protein
LQRYQAAYWSQPIAQQGIPSAMGSFMISSWQLAEVEYWHLQLTALLCGAPTCKVRQMTYV